MKTMTQKQLKNLLRECVMRAHFALPENEEDRIWFEDKSDESRFDFVMQVFEVLDLGNVTSKSKAH